MRLRLRYEAGGRFGFFFLLLAFFKETLLTPRVLGGYFHWLFQSLEFLGSHRVRGKFADLSLFCILAYTRFHGTTGRRT